MAGAEIFTAYNGKNFIISFLIARPFASTPDYKIIFLRRRNILQAVVSVLIAKQTDLWKRWELTQPLEEIAPAVDILIHDFHYSLKIHLEPSLSSSPLKEYCNQNSLTRIFQDPTASGKLSYMEFMV
jgi:hypothetical protein